MSPEATAKIRGKARDFHLKQNAMRGQSRDIQTKYYPIEGDPETAVAELDESQNS